MGESILAEVLGGLGLFLLGGWLASSGLGNALGGRLRERVPHWTSGGRGAFLSGLGLSVTLGWSPSLGASVPALSRRWNLPSERCSLFLGGSALACGLIPLVAWAESAESIGWLVRAAALLAISGGVLVRMARPRLATLGEGLAGHGLLLFGLALLGDGLAGLSGQLGLSFPEVRGSLVATPAAVLIGAVLGIGLGAPAATALTVQAAAAGVASAHSAAALLVGVGASLPWLTARVGRFGDTDDGVVAAVHGALALSFTVCAGLVLFWDDQFPSILGSMPGGAHVALAVFLISGLAAATPMTLVISRPLESFVRQRLHATRPASRVPFMLEPIHQDIPCLAVEGLGASLDAAISEVREVARARLHGAALSQARMDLAQEIVGQVCRSVFAFGSELAPVRWAGSEMAGARAAARTAAACERLLERLLGMPSAPPAGDESLRTELALATARVGNLIEFATRVDEIPLAEDLREHRDALELELLDLCARSGGAEAGLLERLSALKAVVRETIEMAEARAAETGIEPRAEGFAASEPPSEVALDATEPTAALPAARRQRIKSVAAG